MHWPWQKKKQEREFTLTIPANDPSVPVAVLFWNPDKDSLQVCVLGDHPEEVDALLDRYIAYRGSVTKEF